MPRRGRPPSDLFATRMDDQDGGARLISNIHTSHCRYLVPCGRGSEARKGERGTNRDNGRRQGPRDGTDLRRLARGSVGESGNGSGERDTAEALDRTSERPLELWDHMDETNAPILLVQWAEVVRQDPATNHVRGGPSARAYVA